MEIPHLPNLWLPPQTPLACIHPQFNMLFLCSTSAHPRFQSSYGFLSYFVSSPSAPSPSPHAPGCFSIIFCFLLPLTPSWLFNGMLGVSEPAALNFSTLFRPVHSTLFLTLTHLLFSRSLDSLLCDLIEPDPGLASFF